jgi:two-component system chemotaxis response regulator CheY
MAEVLRHAGYWVLEGGLGLEEATRTAVLLPALLVLHLFLDPGAADLIRALRKIPAFAVTPILVVSAATSAEARHHALAAGATAFLEMPFDRQTFLDTVAHLVGKPRPAGGQAMEQGEQT